MSQHNPQEDIRRRILAAYLASISRQAPVAQPMQQAPVPSAEARGIAMAAQPPAVEGTRTPIDASSFLPKPRPAPGGQLGAMRFLPPQMQDDVERMAFQRATQVRQFESQMASAALQRATSQQALMDAAFAARARPVRDISALLDAASERDLERIRGEALQRPKPEKPLLQIPVPAEGGGKMVGLFKEKLGVPGEPGTIERVGELPSTAFDPAPPKEITVASMSGYSRFLRAKAGAAVYPAAGEPDALEITITGEVKYNFREPMRHTETNLIHGLLVRDSMGAGGYFREDWPGGMSDTAMNVAAIDIIQAVIRDKKPVTKIVPRVAMFIRDEVALETIEAIALRRGYSAQDILTMVAKAGGLEGEPE